MIHPHAELRHVGAIEGYGLFASRAIPCGSITYVKDELELIITPDSPLLSMPHYAPVIKRYSYIDDAGNMVLSWDTAKYMNHSCDANTMSTGWGFEIAIRDIEPGEEITDDYGLFLNPDETLSCRCGADGCRGTIHHTDFSLYANRWDGLLKEPVGRLYDVPQPLITFLCERTQRELRRFAETGQGYRSVRSLRSRRRQVPVAVA